MKKELKDGLKKATKITVITLVSIAVAGLFVYFFDFLSNYFWGNEKSPKGELLKVVLTFVAGIVGILVWYTGHRRVKEMQKQTEKTDKQIQIIFKGNVDTRFNNAVGHLSSENATVVLGGIHALHQIAVEHKENYSQVVHNLFCSYIRENSAQLYEKIDIENTPGRCPVIIQTLIDYLFRHYNGEVSIYKDYKSDLSYSTLMNCNFEDINITDVNFRNCDIRKCSFKRATLNDVNFKYAKLSDVKFWEATLNVVSFRKVTVNIVSFWNAKLKENVNFKGTKLEGFTPEEIIRSDFSFAKTKPEKVVEE